MATGIGGLGQSGVWVDGVCVANGSSAPRTGESDIPKTITRSINCGRTQNKLVTDQWNPACIGHERECFLDPPLVPARIDADVYGIQQQAADGTWLFLNTYCAGPPGPPVLDPQAIREQILSLLPVVAIGASSAPFTLVNLETITWADTAKERPLGPITVVGQQVWIKLTYDHATWNYGDGTTENRKTPGNAYPSKGKCSSKLCASYDGHLSWVKWLSALSWCGSGC
jgi:hypothetical protein